MTTHTSRRLFSPLIKLKKVLRLNGASGKIRKAFHYLAPWEIWQDIRLRSNEIETNVNDTFCDPEEPYELESYRRNGRPKPILRLLLSSAQHVGRISSLCWLVAVLEFGVLFVLAYATTVGSRSAWAYVAATVAAVINIAIVGIAWWIAIALTSILGADGLHIVAFHNVGNYKSAKLGFFARGISQLIGYANAHKDEQCSDLRWLNIRAQFDRIARSYAMFGFIRLIGCYLTGIFVFGLTCSWWTWVLGNGAVVNGYSLDRWAWLDMGYFLSVAAVTIGFGDLYFLGVAGKLIGWALSCNLLLNALFIITWYHTYAFSFKERLFAGVCNKARHSEWLENRSLLY